MTKHTNDLENEPSGDPSEEYVHGCDGTDPDKGRAGPGDRDDYMDVAAKPVEKGPEQADHSRARMQNATVNTTHRLSTFLSGH